jgi:hypothetical protein
LKQPSFFIRVLQALLVSAVLVAPAFGRAHQILHAHDGHQPAETALFSEHQEGSLSCLALDHLGSGEAPVGHVILVATLPPVSKFFWVFLENSTPTPVHFFSARAPPTFL